MPNWCQNELEITGPRESLERFKKAAKGLDEAGGLLPFSFQALHPMPLELLGKDCASGTMPDWWNWRVENWGTKWNLGKDVEWDDFNSHDDSATISFDTAWGPPEALILKVAKDFPDLTFNLSYAESGMDFSGTLCAHGDEVTTTSGDYQDSDLAVAMDDEE
jgi:hypothetical protein